MKLPRPIRHKTHKCFGSHSRILDQGTIDASPRLKRSGRTAGSKQVDPSAYQQGLCDYRTRAEKRNADLRRDARQDASDSRTA